MEAIDLIHCVPERLAEKASLDHLLQTAKSIEKWEERHAEVLDYIYRQRLIRLLTGRSPEDDLSALNEHLERMLHPRRLEAMQHLSRPYGERWAAYKDILESRLASLRSRAPQQVIKMAHVEQILDLLLSGRATKQIEIQKILDLKKANLTRVLKVMEANELIERRIEGREKLIRTGPSLERVRLKTKADIPEPQVLEFADLILLLTALNACDLIKHRAEEQKTAVQVGARSKTFGPNLKTDVSAIHRGASYMRSRTKLAAA